MNHVALGDPVFPYGLTSGDVLSAMVYLMMHHVFDDDYGPEYAARRELERRFQ